MLTNQYKTKVNISITIDTAIYLKSKTKPNFNMSGACNDFLKELFKGEEKSIEQLKKEYDEAIIKSTSINCDIEQKMNEASEQAAKELSQAQNKEKAELEAIPIGNSFQNKLEREKLFKNKPELKTKWEERND